MFEAAKCISQKSNEQSFLLQLTSRLYRPVICDWCEAREFFRFGVTTVEATFLLEFTNLIQICATSSCST